MTDRYGVIGHPVAHSKSPVIHQQFATQMSQDLTYETFDIAPENLTQELNTLIESGVKGLNVTVPHKNAVADLVGELTERARLAGAVNTISIDRNGEHEGRQHGRCGPDPRSDRKPLTSNWPINAC